VDEIFDIVDEFDQVIGQASRAVVHREGMRHRAVHILVFDQTGRLLLQLRSATKDEFPLCYTSSASGHVAAGETYDATAVRELEEELGIAGSPEFLTRIPASPETANEFTAVYRLTTHRDARPHPEEIAALEWSTLADVAARIQREPQRFSPPFRKILDWYLNESSFH
jgi:isopentenyl-diphosphate delta-isomerase type 1